MKENLKIELNANIIKRLKAEDIYSDHMMSCVFIMFALNEKRIDLLDEFDDSNKNKRAILLYAQLEYKGFLEKTDKVVKHNYKLTLKGQKLVNYIRAEYAQASDNELTSEILETAVVPKSIPRDSEWISQYIAMFPEHLQDHENIVRLRMQEFMKTFSYDIEAIMHGTKMYINELAESQTGFEYCQRSMYFIMKGKGADKTWNLATWCKKWLEKGTKNEVDTSFMDML